MIVQVFKTNVTDVKASQLLVKQLLNVIPESRVSFDLEDCDRVLRIKAKAIMSQNVIEILNANGYY